MRRKRLSKTRSRKIFSRTARHTGGRNRINRFAMRGGYRL